MAILNSALVLECRRRFEAGESQTALVQRFGVSRAQVSRILSETHWSVLPEDRLCEECGKPGLEPSHNNTRRLHVACAKERARQYNRDRRADPDYRDAERAAWNQTRAVARAERYESDPGYRARVDTAERFSLKGRPPLEATSIRVLWTRYRLREPDFQRLLAWQNDACPCGDAFGPFRGPRDTAPNVDHDHGCCPGTRTCGQCVRGLLHARCNVLVGRVENGREVCDWVAGYLAGPPYQQMLREERDGQARAK